MSINLTTFWNREPINIVYSQWDFNASRTSELTIKKNQTLLLLSDLIGDWVVVRRCGDPLAGVMELGLVPTSYLKERTTRIRGYAIYPYDPESGECIRMYVGWKLGVYVTLGEWALVKLDVMNTGKAEVGYVRRSYINIFDESGNEELGPPSLKQLPERYCFLCETSVVGEFYWECTRCRLPNGHPFLICPACESRRQACFAHQVLNGQDHLFDLRKATGLLWTCDGCSAVINGVDFDTCLLCHYLKGQDFDLCGKCRNDPRRKPHEHAMIAVSKEGRFTVSHVVALRETMQPAEGLYSCNSCYRAVPGYVLHCRVCPDGGFDLCLECAEIDRGTYLHDKWTRGEPHDFEIVKSE